ncbi:MAG: UDP-N-acetylmuramoyl-L-alanyl-D-glutamate--2,6-diaminopimelate ligase [Candidatus Omnitrophica bacterium]|nr:UDP-N-acetylmuramoyl-L-alanyl-D-glutamate--2,6-diaminopimelate ligase [Candidatus Omnitrophota bacterium]MDD5592311.1 UDP-N-acetylmuramoyl-L-alanyl-D-glutamate--2,6-diaminopimelate ligase [Candidatus Omnitrophota bacterium]
MRLKQLIESLGSDTAYTVFKDFEVSGISCNSQGVSDNFIFVAIKGEDADGHKFIDEAIKRGTKAVIVSSQWPVASGQERAVFIKVKDTRKALAKLAAKFYGNPSAKIKVVGVTGTNGKTTITYLLESLLKDSGFEPAVIGTVNYRFKNKTIPSGNTTPGPCQLQPLLADMAQEGINYAVMEVSSHALSQERVEGIDFHSAIFTNLTQDHLDYHKTLENYFQAKARLFQGLSRGAFAVINNDDPYGRRIKGLIRGCKVVTYGIEEPSDIMAGDIKYGIAHTDFMLKGIKKEIHFKTRLIGRHNVYNVLASYAWAFQEGLNPETIKSSLEGFDSVPGRLQRIGRDRDFSIFVDYAHTEDALKNVINALREVSDKRIIVVFGCGGGRDKTKRPKMGHTASELADYVIITSDNPRNEDPEKIIRDIKKGIRKNNYFILPDRKEAIKKSLSLAQAGDMVLIAGKGHENYQVLKDKRIHFDDCEAVKECLELMNY